MYKALIIAYYFPPKGLSGVQRTLKFVKYMPKYGWQPTVLTSGDTAYYAHDYGMLKELESEDIKVFRVAGKEINSLLKKKKTVQIPREIFRKTLQYISSWFFVPDNKILWANKAYKKAEELIEEGDYKIIFVTGPPFSTVNIATRLKKKYDIPVIVDYRDLWYGFHFAVYPTLAHKFLVKRTEYDALKIVDRIVVTNRRIKEKIMNNFKFVGFHDIAIIPHGYDKEDFDNIPIVKKETSKMVLTYSGMFYEYITPRFFLQAFKKLSFENPEIAANIELQFIGFLRAENKKYIRKLGLQNYVREFGYLEHSEALKKIMASDVLWLMVGRGRNADTISSSKLYEYYGTRKPIFGCLPDGALRTSLEEYGCGFCAEPDNIEEIKLLIYKIYEHFRNHSFPTPDEDFVESHRRDYLTEQLVKEFQFVAKNRL